MATMRAIRIHAFGPATVLELEDLPVPTIDEGEVLIRVHAASVNPVDYKTRAGQFPPVSLDQLPKVLGRDVAGTIIQTGSRRTHWELGTDVYAMVDASHGGYAEYVALGSELCAVKPSNLSFVEAAAVPLAALTAWQGLFEHGQLQAGQWVLIHGGAGGVGHFAIQLAKARGAQVATTVSKRDVAFVKGLGADRVFAYDEEQFEDHVQGLDLVLDLVGGDVQDRSFGVLKRGGKLVSTLQHPDTVRAEELGLHVTNFMTQPSSAHLTEITHLIEAGNVRPRIVAVYGLDQVRTAQTRLERQHSRGKIVLECDVSPAAGVRGAS